MMTNFHLQQCLISKLRRYLRIRDRAFSFAVICVPVGNLQWFCRTRNSLGDELQPSIVSATICLLDITGISFPTSTRGIRLDFKRSGRVSR